MAGWRKSLTASAPSESQVRLAMVTISGGLRLAEGSLEGRPTGAGRGGWLPSRHSGREPLSVRRGRRSGKFRYRPPSAPKVGAAPESRYTQGSQALPSQTPAGEEPGVTVEYMGWFRRKARVRHYGDCPRCGHD